MAYPNSDTDIERMFTYRKWTDAEVEKYAVLRHYAKQYALSVLHLLPESVERTLAIRAIHDASMKVNLAVSMHPLEEKEE